MRYVAVFLLFMISTTQARAYGLFCEELFAVKTRNEIAIAMNAIPEHEIRAVENLKALTLETGHKLGLSKLEVEDVLATFAENGVIGGQLHIQALFEGLELNGVTDPIRISQLATKEDLKKAFGPLLRPLPSRQPLQFKASHMSTWVEIHARYNPQYQAVYEVLKDPRHGALLRLWFEVSMKSMMKAAIDAAPRKLTRQLGRLPEAISANAKWPTLVGTVGTISMFHPSLLTSVEVVASGLGLFTAGINARKIPVYGWLTNRFAAAQQKHLRAVAPLKLLALEPTAAEKTAIGLPQIPEFEFNEQFAPFTLPLRAEIARQEFTVDVQPGDTDASLAHVMDSVVPVLRLTTDTFTAQIVRLKEVEAKADEFISKHEHVNASDAHLSRQESEIVETNAVRLREHLSALKADLNYTLTAMARQKTILHYAVAQAEGPFPQRAEQLRYFHQYAVDAENKLVAKAREHIKTIDARLFELNKQVLLPLID